MATRHRTARHPGLGTRRWLSALIVALMCALSAPFFVGQVALGPPVVAGVADFSASGPLARPIELAGQWRFGWRSPPTPGAFTMRVPGPWAGVSQPGGGPLPERGEASYRVVLRDLPPARYRLYVPTIFGASRLTIDGEPIVRLGRLGPDPEYLVRPLEGDFVVKDRGSVTVAIDIATGSLRANGIDSPPVLGNVQAMQFWGAKRWAQEFIVLIALVLLGIIGLVVFLFRRSDRASLYLAVMCFGFMPASLLAGYDNMFALMFPRLDTGLVVAVAWSSAMLGVAGLLANTHALFPGDGSTRIYRALMALSFALAAVLLVTFAVAGSYTGSWVARFQPPAIAVILVYIVAVILRATLRGREGAAPMLIGVVVAGAAILAVAAVASGELAADFARGGNYAAFGALALLFANLVVLAERWAHAISTTEKTNDDLRQLLEVSSSITSEIKLEALLRRIVNATSQILGAARSTLFLHDDKRNQLWSIVAEGVTRDEIRIASGEGLAGKAFTTGETIVAPDAHAHPDFNRAVDERTGFRTGSVISMPIATREGRRLGVMQALNPPGAERFDEDDIGRMRAFAAQAAIALDNATLFAEVVSSRNYNESILASMSSGVITLDPAMRVAKLNRAAGEIFGLDPAAAEGLAAGDLFGTANLWLVEEIGEVLSSHEPKALLDAELVQGEGAPRSVNLSIVPLINDGEQTGALVLVEDIGEGKRLRGAMRRFMPPQVVEEVLTRHDELLFGSAAHASVLFADIRGFTSLSEALSPRETVDMLNEVFTELYEAVAGTDGMLDKYIGDAVMAVFGVPFAGERDAANAVEAAVRMIGMIEAINARREAGGAVRLALGVGIASGEVVAGTVGSPKRMDYTVIGDSVNLAARLQDLTKAYRVAILVSETTMNEAGGLHPARELDRIRVRGRQTPERIFEILRDEPGRPAPSAWLAAWERGQAALARRDWGEAATAFGAVLGEVPDDHPAQLMRDRALAAQQDPPAADWDGVW